MTQELQRVGIVGAGAMGRGIAQVCASAGCEVLLFDAAAESVPRAIELVRADLGQAVSRGKATAADVEATLSRIRPAQGLVDFAACELVVEAIVEQLEAKQALFQSLAGVVSPQCVLASNTSSLSVTAIAAACPEPGRVAGWHFFNPVPRMKVVEVIGAPRTERSVVDALVALSRRIGHRPIVTTDSPGFVVNHAGRAFVTEGLKLLAERTAEHPVLDAIMRAAGFRMGPFELLDLTGLDVSVPVMESIHAQYYGDDRYRPAAFARTRLLAGLLGRKSGQGFYDHRAGSSTPAAAVSTDEAPSTLRLWWPSAGTGALPPIVADDLPAQSRVGSAEEADLILVAPIGRDLSSTVVALRLDAGKAVAVDPLFFGPAGCTLMTTPATAPATVAAARNLFAACSIPTHVIADSPGFVAPRIVACIVNLACEMAQQGIATPQDIDAAVRLGLGYPVGPFEWGERLGATVVLQVLRGLQDTFGDPRYRPSPWLVRRATLDLPLSAPDRQT